jgi:hypothetical protein
MERYSLTQQGVLMVGQHTLIRRANRKIFGHFGSKTVQDTTALPLTNGCSAAPY